MKTTAKPNLETVNRSFSLTYALRALARKAGHDLDDTDLNAALGLSFMTSAPRDAAEDLSWWSLCARDAYLVEAGRLFGIGIREVHPPEAALGLHNAEAFAQHFEASYRPLVARALENGQPVLAWQGWPGEDEALWGILRHTGAEGVGVAGIPLATPDAPTEVPDVALVRCPVQLYVVETLSPKSPPADDLLDMVLAHARGVLADQLGARFGVVTGLGAYNAWIERTKDLEAGGSSPADESKGHQQLAAAIIAGHQSGIRFLQAQLDRSTPEIRTVITTLTASCHKVVTALTPSLDAKSVGAMLRDAAGRAKLAGQLGHARDAATEMLGVLDTHLRPAS